MGPGISSALISSSMAGWSALLLAAADAIVRVGWLAADLGARLAELDVNPLVLREQGAGAKVVDALVIGRKS